MNLNGIDFPVSDVFSAELDGKNIKIELGRVVNGDFISGGKINENLKSSKLASSFFKKLHDECRRSRGFPIEENDRKNSQTISFAMNPFYEG